MGAASVAAVLAGLTFAVAPTHASNDTGDAPSAPPAGTREVDETSPVVGTWSPASAHTETVEVGSYVYWDFAAKVPAGEELVLESGDLAPGLELIQTTASDGTRYAEAHIEGTVTTVGTYSFRATGKIDNSRRSPVYTTVVRKATPTITSPTPLEGVEQLEYRHTFSATGTNATWRVSEGTLPPGLAQLPSDDDTATIAGIPTEAGTWDFTMAVTNSIGTQDTKVSLGILPAPRVGALADGFAGLPYSHQLVLEQSPIAASHWAITEGALPDGLLLDPSTGLISGKPARAGTTPLTVTASTELGSIANTTTLTVHNGPQITSPKPAGGMVGKRYEHALTASGLGDTVWEITKNALPTGLSLDQTTGLISGIPTEAGESTFTVSATNDAGTAAAAYTISIRSGAPVITPQTPPDGAVRTRYSYEIAGVDLDDATWSVFYTDKLPPGLILQDRSGQIYGTPRQTGEWTFTITAASASGVGSAELTIKIVSGPPVFDSYPGAIELQGSDDHDVAWFVMGAFDGQIHAIVDEDKPANLDYAGREYIHVELHDEKDATVRAISINGDQSFYANQDSINWSVEKNWSLVVSHAETGKRVKLFTSGHVQPLDDARSQRFLFANSLFVKEKAVAITAPAAGATVSTRPAIAGTATAGFDHVIVVTARGADAVVDVGKTTVDAAGTWTITVPPDKPLPFDDVTITATVENRPADSGANVTVSVVPVVARLTMTASVKEVSELPSSLRCAVDARSSGAGRRVLHTP